MKKRGHTALGVGLVSGLQVDPNQFPEELSKHETSGRQVRFEDSLTVMSRDPKMTPLLASFRLQAWSARISRCFVRYDETQEADSTGACELASSRRARGSSARVLGTYAWSTRRCLSQLFNSTPVIYTLRVTCWFAACFAMATFVFMKGHDSY